MAGLYFLIEVDSLLRLFMSCGCVGHIFSFWNNDLTAGAHIRLVAMAITYSEANHRQEDVACRLSARPTMT